MCNLLDFNEPFKKRCRALEIKNQVQELAKRNLGNKRDDEYLVKMLNGLLDDPELGLQFTEENLAKLETIRKELDKDNDVREDAHVRSSKSMERIQGEHLYDHPIVEAALKSRARDIMEINEIVGTVSILWHMSHGYKPF